MHYHDSAGGIGMSFRYMARCGVVVAIGILIGFLVGLVMPRSRRHVLAPPEWAETTDPPMTGSVE